jgi:hypothetical protein
VDSEKIRDGEFLITSLQRNISRFPSTIRGLEAPPIETIDTVPSMTTAVVLYAWTPDLDLGQDILSNLSALLQSH